MPSGNLEVFGVQQAPEVEAPEVEAEETQDAPGDDAPETPSERLVRMRGSLHKANAPDEGAVAAGVQRQMDELKGSVEGRLDTIREDLRSLGKSDEDDTPAPVAGINFEDEDIGGAFRTVYESEDPRAFGRAVGAVVAEGVAEVRRELSSSLDELEADSTLARETVESNDSFAGNMRTAIPSIRSMGESEDAVMDDYLANGTTSFLGQYLQKYPMLAQDVEGIVGAALSVARMIEIADARMNSTEADSGESAEPETAETEARAVHTEAAPSRGSNRSVRRIKDDAKGKEDQLTPGDRLRQSIVDSRGPGRGLPKAFH